MRYEHDGMSLWYGTPDALAPEGVASVGSDITITIGVLPIDASNKVDLLYRINQGPVETVVAKWLRHDLSRKAQYFRVRLPVFCVGDTVEYTAVCSCAGRQVPSPEDEKKLASSFHVVEAEIKLKSDLTAQEVLPLRTGLVRSELALASEVGLQLKQFVVKGQIRQADGDILVGVVVRAFNRNLRSEDFLGETKTDHNGSYEIVYTPEQFRRAHESSADLVIKVVNSAGELQAISPIFFDASPVQTIDLMIGGGTYRGPSEYEQLVATLTPLLEGISPADLTNDDTVFLVGETKGNSTYITYFALANKLARDTDIQPEVFYGFAREGLPTNLPNLLSQAPATQRNALKAAVAQNIIPARFSQDIDGILTRLKQLIVQQSLQPLSQAGKASFGDLLDTTLPNEELKSSFVTDYINHAGPIQDFWAALEQEPKFKDHVAGLQFTFQLSALTNNHIPLVQELQRLYEGKEITSLRDLTRFDAQGWQEFLTNAKVGAPAETPGKNEMEQLRNYAQLMAHALEDAFPTSYIARRIENEQVDGKEDLITFFKNNEEQFDLTSIRLTTYLSEHPEALKGISNSEALRARVSGMQRVYNLAPRYTQACVLLNDGIDSALRITQMGQTTFLIKYNDSLGGRFQARQVYERAAQTNATAIHLLATYGMGYSKVGMKAVPDTIVKQVEGIPDWSTLFGSLDLCACEDCRSVDSPAAYLVDILHFLNNRLVIDTITYKSDNSIDLVTYKKKTKPTCRGGDLSVKDILFERRADLGEIELTCENTNTPLPYVDLVNEILENAIQPPSLFVPFTLATQLVSDLDNRTLSSRLAQAFNPSLSNDATITVKKEGKWWTIDEPAYSYTIREENDAYWVLSRSLQTSGTAQERATNPQYVNAGAYDTLRQQVYPWTLPLDLRLEEVRTYLGQLGIRLYALMESFLPGDRATALANINIAREYLGLTTAESQIINGTTMGQSGAANPGVWNLWGFGRATLDVQNGIPDPQDRTKWIVSGAWLDVLTSRIDVFLQQSGLNYIDLLDLLGSYYINPLLQGTRLITIQSIDASMQDTCQLDQLKLVGIDLTSNIASKIVWFVRLWRKLSWTQRELDQAITALHPPALNDTFLTQLSHIKRLEVALNIPIDSLLSFWAPLDTAAYIDFTTTTPLPSLYTRLFRNKTVVNPLEPDFPEDPATLTGKLSDHVATLTAVLGISATDLALLFNDSNVIPQLPDPTQLTQSIPDDTLSLDQLSLLYRHITLAKAIQLSIREYLSALRLITGDPFASTATTVLFVEHVSKVNNSGFSLTELDYLLRHVFTDASGVTPTDEQIALILDALRAGLQKIVAENSFSDDPADPNGITTDPNGDLTKKKLALLNWDSAVIQQAIAILNDATGYTVPLNTLAPGIKFTDQWTGKIYYDSSTQTLHYSHVMTLAEKALLQAIPSADNLFLAAVNALFNAPRAFIVRNMQTFSVQNFSVLLAVLPAPVVIPSALKRKVYYDVTLQQFHCIGALSERERDTLLNLSNDASYTIAINALFAAPSNVLPTANDTFLTAADIALLFDNDINTGVPIIPETRFRFVLKKVLPYLCTTLSNRLIIQKISAALQLETRTAEDLLTKWVNSPNHPPSKAIDEFRSALFVESDPNIRLNRIAFPDQFAIFTLLHKISLVITRFQVTSKQLPWLFTYRALAGDPTRGWLDLNALPLAATAAATGLFNGWERLVDLFRLRGKLPLGETVLSSLFEQVHIPGTIQTSVLSYLSEQIRWSLDDVNDLIGPKGFNFTFPDAYKDERALIRLLECFVLLKRLGLSAQQSLKLTDNTLLTNSVQAEQLAHMVKEAVKAKYDEDQWLTLAQPLRDALREKQRAALVAYLITHADQTKNQYWRDSNDLYTHFLIDVEMSPCQMTSRIKQAISSVQLFVQRCLMHLESEVMASAEVDSQWREWKWMKNYRVWEANRKIFLYPENWIEPELRDDKSVFFRDLENELQQSNLTKDTAETAFLHYLEKLDAVANLEVVSFYHQEEYDLTGNKVVDVLHVFGRTRGTPPIYYYRQRIDSAYWTSWEKVDAGIEGNHLIPMIWNRRLYLFWPIFTEKQAKQTITLPQPGGTLGDGDHYWEIKIAWSEYQNKKWPAKKVSYEYLTSKCLDDISHITFRAVIEQATNDLLILCVYPPPPGACPDTEIGEGNFGLFRFSGCNSTPIAVGPTTCTPIAGYPCDNIYKRLTPQNTDLVNMALLEIENDDDVLYLITSDFKPGENYSQMCIGDPILQTTPGLFQVVYPHQDEQFTSQRPFFFQHFTKSFFVIPIPYRASNSFKKLANARSFDPVMLNTSPIHIYKELQNPPIPDPVGPVIIPRDPVIFEPSFPLEQKLPARLSAGTGGLGPSLLLPTRNGPTLSASSKPVIEEFTTRINDIPAQEASSFFPVFHYQKTYVFSLFYHPYLCNFIQELNLHGVDGLLQRPLQLLSRDFFANDYSPMSGAVKTPYPKEEVDFCFAGSYTQYNWELFFHVPLLIASRLSQNQQFEDAQAWFHYIFDPTDTSGFPSPQRYWRTKHFFNTTSEQYYAENIPNLLRFLANRDNSQGYAKLTDEQRCYLASLEDQVAQWRKNPFEPHLIARFRTTAYQKTVVMKYIDNLIAWGDQLFSQDTLESINEATQLYILAAEILGRRPEEIPPRAVPEVQTYNTLECHLDAFSNALVQIEEFVPPSAGTSTFPITVQLPMTLPNMLYFCVPKNDKLLSYWDTVADRLFKIRHCMNIEGVARQLPLFEPPIDPALLVKAIAAGVDISSALNEINATLPHYRFSVMAQKTAELCTELKALGSALLTALEKRDAETLGLLRSTHELAVLNAVRQVKQLQIDEAKATLAGLNKSKEVVNERFIYYRDIAFMNDAETAQLALEIISRGIKEGLPAIIGLASLLHLIPDTKIGAPTSMGATEGGSNAGASTSRAAEVLSKLGDISSHAASLAGMVGGHQRRYDDWQLQKRLASKELDQIDQQIVAAQLRQAIAEQELQNQDLQIAQAQEIDDFLHEKFTDQDLYDWMVGQISSIYFQTYQLTYDLAKRTERAFRQELGLLDSNFIQFGYWDSLKKGLLAGEQLYHDLKRMEVAYLDQNKREYEITKHISLAQLDPVALVQLKQSGQCFFSLPEVLFDLDYPGHYMRRIKLVNLTIPCVVGPYISVSCTLTKIKSSVRHANTQNGKYARMDNDIRFTDTVGAIESVAISSAQNDSGLFEVNLHDDRYLPFEGTGVISDWHLELPQIFHAFDYDTISDVVLQIRYTAREGGGLLKQQAIDELQAALNAIPLTENQKGLGRLFSIRHEFPNEWYRFTYPANTTGNQTLTLPLTSDRFSFLFRHHMTITIGKIELFVKIKDKFAATYNANTLSFALALGDSAPTSTTAQPDMWNGMVHTEGTFTNPPGNLTLNIWLNTGDQVDLNALDDIFVVCHYSVAKAP